MNTRLEYSPTEGKFNQAQPEDQQDVARGYKTLCCFVNVERASRFTEAILIKYPELSSVTSKPFPSFSQMKDEVYQFLAEDIKILEQHMSATFKRRTQLLNQL